jgi:hypothetical protein
MAEYVEYEQVPTAEPSNTSKNESRDTESFSYSQLQSEPRLLQRKPILLCATLATMILLALVFVTAIGGFAVHTHRKSCQKLTTIEVHGLVASEAPSRFKNSEIQ